MLTGEKTVVQIARERLLENRQWIDDNIKELQKQFAGEWVAVLQKEVVAHAKNPKELRSAIAGREDEAVVLRIPEGDVRIPI